DETRSDGQRLRMESRASAVDNVRTELAQAGRWTLGCIKGDDSDGRVAPRTGAGTLRQALIRCCNPGGTACQGHQSGRGLSGSCGPGPGLAAATCTGFGAAPAPSAPAPRGARRGLLP